GAKRPAVCAREVQRRDHQRTILTTRRPTELLHRASAVRTQAMNGCRWSRSSSPTSQAPPPALHALQYSQLRTCQEQKPRRPAESWPVPNTSADGAATLASSCESTVPKPDARERWPLQVPARTTPGPGALLEQTILWA